MDRDQIKKTIEERLLDRFYIAGERLNERDLAAEFGVSRTPIRDVLARLQSEGLVEHRERRGVFVKEVSLTYVLSLLEFLAVLESSCARLAARSGSVEDKKELLALAKQTTVASAEGVPEYSLSNKLFHELMYQMTSNDELVSAVFNVRRKVAPYRRHIHRVAGMTAESAQEHIAIAEAIMQRDEKLAADLMFHHLDMTRSEFMPFITSLGKVLFRS